MEQKRVLILAEHNDEIKKELKRRFSARCELTFAEDLQDLDAALSRAEMIIGEPEQAQLARAAALSVLQLTWAGADKYAGMPDFPEQTTLCNVSGAFGTIISEYVLASIVAFYRALPAYWRDQKSHIWQQRKSSRTICGKRVLVLGMGDLGGNVARRMQAFGARVTGVRRTEKADIPTGFDEAHTLDALDALLPEADIVVNCLPSTLETVGLMTRPQLLAMKSGALFVNVGRGSFVRNDDLVFALERGHLGGAILDVTETEPLPEDSPLWDMENVLITPHIAGPSFDSSPDVQTAIWDICMENLDNFLTGKPVTHVVSRRAGY